MTTQFELVSKGGRSVYAADTLDAVRAQAAMLAARGTQVWIERVDITRKPVS